MTSSNNSPENPLAQFLSTEELSAMTQPAQIPEGAARVLGGIGLGRDIINEGLIPKEEPDRSPDLEYTKIIENIRQQANVSHSAYATALNETVLDAVDRNEHQQSLEDKIEQWKQNNTFKHISEQTKKDPDLKFELVTVPDFFLLRNDLFNILNKFSTDQGFDCASIANGIENLEVDVLCGERDANLGNAVRFVLFPNKLTVETTEKSPSSHLAELEALKQATGAPLSLPSVMEIAFWWYTRREQVRIDTNDPSKSYSPTDFHDTYARHILPTMATNNPSVNINFQSYIANGNPCISNYNNIGIRTVLGK